MKFRAELSNASTFQKLITSLSPVSKTATLKLTPETLHLICRDGSVQVWSQIKMGSIFDLDSLRIESNTNNEIYLELSTEALGIALRSAKGSSACSIKLTKKGGEGTSTGKGSKPYLTLTAKNASAGGRGLEIVQDVGVKVMKQSEVELIKEPLCPTPDVSILMPSLNNLKNVTDRLKSIGPIITILANNSGDFRLKVESDDAKVQSEWRGLKNPKPMDEEENEEVDQVDPTQLFSVAVEAKHLLKFLNSYTIATSTIACICENHCAIFYVYVGDARAESEGGVLTFFVPGLASEEF